MLSSRYLYSPLSVSPRKLTLVGAAVCALILGLAACGGGEGSSSSEAELPPPPQAPSEATPAPAPGPSPSPSPAPAPGPGEPPVEPPPPPPSAGDPVPAPPEPAPPPTVLANNVIPTPTSVPAGAVAVVGEGVIEQEEFDLLVNQRERVMASAGGEFPPAGTREYEEVKNALISLLVQREQFLQEAAALGITVSAEDVAARLAELIDELFDGDDEHYRQELDQQSLTEQQVLETLELQMLHDKLLAKLTAGLSVTDEEIETFYAENQQAFSTPDSRLVAHILVESQADADGLHTQLQAGADFAELARDHSIDTGTAESGGEYEAVRGYSVPEFETIAYELATGEISEPVETQFGWHVIKALEDIVPASVQPLDDVREQIEGLIRREKETVTTERWASALEEKYEGKVLFAPGFEPPPAGPVDEESEPEPSEPELPSESP